MRRALEASDPGALPVKIVPCAQVIAMAESPAAAIRGKPDSSIVRAIQDHKAGLAQAFVSAGSTGAVVAASLIILGRLTSVDRPAIATLMPASHGHFLLLDVGANVQCSPQHLLRFAEMGDVYCREILELAQPRVGLLNIGEEETKGSELAVAAHHLLRQSPLRFVGNIESRRLLMGDADVVITDGFTGNIVLKLVEGLSPFLRQFVSEGCAPDEQEVLAPALAILQRRLDYADYGGALLLGIDGVSVISHGASSARAIGSAVLSACRLARRSIPEKLQAALSRRA